MHLVKRRRTDTKSTPSYRGVMEHSSGIMPKAIKTELVFNRKFQVSRSKVTCWNEADTLVEDARML